MHFKLIVVFVEEDKTGLVMDTSREHGATGATVISHARGEGLKAAKTFLGLNLETPRDIVLLVVEEHMSRHILESISEAAEFDSKPGTGIAIQIDVEDAVGVMHQVEKLAPIVEEEL